jgi:hypothetical protein
MAVLRSTANITIVDHALLIAVRSAHRPAAETHRATPCPPVSVALIFRRLVVTCTSVVLLCLASGPQQASVSPGSAAFCQPRRPDTPTFHEEPGLG